MSYLAAVDHLLSLTPELSPTVPRRKFDLEHMRILARALGDPQTRFPSILIAGTNGKGSTAATLASILTAAGLHTGLYTSPHLTRPTERIRTSNPTRAKQGAVISTEARSAQWRDPRIGLAEATPLSEIPEESFARLYFQVDSTANRLVATSQLPHHPSFFETLTALAFLYFAEQQVDIAVLEVGLGGRLDATNIVEPLISVITDIALDHQDYLGNTIAEIAREKAGILRPNGTLITLPQHPEANQAIGEAAIALNVHAISATPYLPNRDASMDTVILSRVPQVRPQVDPGNTTPQKTPVIQSEAHPHQTVILSRVPQVRPQVDPGNTTPQKTPVILSEARSAQSKDLPPGSHPQNGPHLSAATPVLPPPPNHYTLHLNGDPLHVRSPLPGEHQRRNIALAIATALELRNHHAPVISTEARSAQWRDPRISSHAPPAPATSHNMSYKISNTAIELGIANTHWPGRLEFLPPNLLLDVAHNPAGAWTLRAAVAALPESQPRTLIFSCLRDKDLTEISRILFPLFDSPTPNRVPQVRPQVDPGNTHSAHQPATNNVERTTHNLILTPISNPRAASLDSLVAAARALSVPAHTAATPAEALTLARRITPPNGLILATGSIYLIGALREAALTP